jgi:putative NADH-flavin reductase
MLMLGVKGGHAVRALVRDSGAACLPTTVRAVQGDARSESDVASTMSGVDVVVSALGMGLKTTPDGLLVDATRALIAAGASTGVRRVVMLSSWRGGGVASLLTPHSDRLSGGQEGARREGAR